GGGMAEVVYQVPWKVINAGDAVERGGLVVYWFPASENEWKNSSMRNSRTLTLYAGQCVTMGVADIGAALGKQFAVDEKAPVAVLAESGGKIIGKAQGGSDGKRRVGQGEKRLEGEGKAREGGGRGCMETAKGAAKRVRKGARRRQ